MAQAGFNPPKQSATQVLKLSRRSTSKPPRLDYINHLNRHKYRLELEKKKANFDQSLNATFMPQSLTVSTN